LWYSAYLPLFFFVSSIVAGLSMVMFEGSLAHKYYHDKMDRTHLNEASEVVLGFGKAAALVLSGYFVMKVIGIAVDNNWHYLATGWGAWFLVELIGFVALPALAFAIGVREKNRKLIQRTAAWAVLGIVVNRLNVSLIAFNWQLPAADRYFPSWMEIMTSLFIVTLGVTVYRLIVTFLPILHEHPEYKDSH